MSSFPYGTMNSSEDYSLNFHGSFSSFINNGNDMNRPMKQPRTSASDPPTSQLISFGNGVITADELAKTKHEADSIVDPDNGVSQSYNPNGGIISSRNPFKAQEHVLAERKRREKQTQRLIALSAAIPTLKKMDKATILEEAVKYIKQLEQRIDMLKKKAAAKSMESTVTVKKSQVSADDDESSSYNTFKTQYLDQKLLEIEARVSEKYILIRVHCQRRSNCITRILNLIEGMNLMVLSNSIIQFGSSILDITVVTQIEAKFDMTIDEVIKNLRQNLLYSM